MTSHCVPIMALSLSATLALTVPPPQNKPSMSAEMSFYPPGSSLRLPRLTRLFRRKEAPAFARCHRQLNRQSWPAVSGGWDKSKSYGGGLTYDVPPPQKNPPEIVSWKTFDASEEFLSPVRFLLLPDGSGRCWEVLGGAESAWGQVSKRGAGGGMR